MRIFNIEVKKKYILSFFLSFLIAFLTWYQSCLLLDISKNFNSDTILISINKNQLTGLGFSSIITLLYFFQNISLYQ